MGCNCNKGPKHAKVVYTHPNGTKTTYNTEIEARAAQIRNGGSYTVVSR